MKLKGACLIGLICAALASCSPVHDRDAGKTVFRYNEAAGITSLDPAFSKDLATIWACNQLFNGLVQLDDQLRIQPCIARSWTISEDGLLYTFNLRDDVYFHDDSVFNNGQGRRVTAHDFEYSLNRLADPSVAAPGAWVLNNVMKENDHTLDCHALNDTVFTIRLSSPFTPFPGLLSMPYCSVVPKEAVEYYGHDFRRHPVGTGPFRFKYWLEGVKLVLVKNDRYFERDGDSALPYLDAVAITFLGDKQSAFFEFIKGNLDFLSGIDASYKDELLTGDGRLNPEYESRFQLLSTPYLNTEYLGILIDTNLPVLKNSPLRSLAIRKAINYGFDRKKMMRFLRNNIGTPGIYGIIPPGMPSFDSAAMAGYDFHPDSARLLLSEAGYLTGWNMPEITISTTADYLDLCKYIQHELSEIGFRIKIDVNPPATLKELKAQAKLPFFRASWIADYPDAENYLSLFYSRNFCPGGPNYCHFADAEYDALYEKSLSETDDSLRFQYNRRMNRIMMDDAPVVILYYDQVMRFARKDIQGLGINPINLLSLKKVRKN
jgi:peptide/nickel transport system substrate-binding protein